MVEVKLAFPTLEEAIAALGKMAGLGAKVKAAGPKTEEHPAVVEIKERMRAERSDKGKARGPYKKGSGAATPATSEGSAQPSSSASEPSAPEASSPEAEPAQPEPAPAQPEPAPAPAEVIPASTPPTLEEAQAAVEKVFNAKGISVALEVLSRFGVKRVKDVRDTDRKRLIEDCDAAVA